ncbi:hypothetical protein [Curtobacterium sp. MCBA15_001]|uniref:hypothetical protein n=1 Tax=Curtobacterium sp. MCBA15_001 TaxID=1898731 RepID=UPI0011133C42|nr:hypothetical protein [Curtobacterium sp. MCBA15_001]
MSIITLTAVPASRRALNEEERYEFYNNILEHWQHFQEGIFTEWGLPSNRVRVQLSLAEATILFTLIYCCEEALTDNPGKDVHTLTEHAAVIGFNESLTTEKLSVVRQLVSFHRTTEHWSEHEQEVAKAGSPRGS